MSRSPGPVTAEQRRRLVSDGFEEPDEPFVDDDGLMTSALAEEALQCIDDGQNFVERDDFERELGSPAEEDPFSEDFTGISKYEIVDVVGDDRAGRPIIVVYAYRLPSNKTFDHQKFLRYLQYTLDKFVNQDYTIVYFHYGLKSNNKPPLSWLFQAYRMLDRRYKKNLKAMYLVHPTRFIRLIWNMFKPFISRKFERKLHYVNYLAQLKEFVRTDQLGLPPVIQEHDAQLKRSSKMVRQSTGAAEEPLPTQQFGVSLSFILRNHPGHQLPPLVVDLLAYLRSEALTTEGIFRRSANLTEVRKVQKQINFGESINFSSLGNVHLAAVLLKTFLRELNEPLMTFDLYNMILTLNDAPADQRTASAKKVVEQLPPENYFLLKTLIQFLTEVMARSDVNLMNANNLAVVFGPNLCWSREQQVSLSHLQHLNNFCYRLLTNFNQIFCL